MVHTMGKYLALCKCGQQVNTIERFNDHITEHSNPTAHYWVDVPDILITKEREHVKDIRRGTHG